MPTLTESAKTLARSFEHVEEAVACAGTALEQSSFRAGKKAFLFVHERDGLVTLRLKLDAGFQDAVALAKAEPKVHEAGKQGWVTVRLPARARLPPVVKGWIGESHGLAAGAVRASKSSASKRATAKRRTAKASKKPGTQR